MSEQKTTAEQSTKTFEETRKKVGDVLVDRALATDNPVVKNRLFKLSPDDFVELDLTFPKCLDAEGNPLPLLDARIYVQAHFDHWSLVQLNTSMFLENHQQPQGMFVIKKEVVDKLLKEINVDITFAHDVYSVDLKVNKKLNCQMSDCSEWVLGTRVLHMLLTRHDPELDGMYMAQYMPKRS